MSSLRCILQRSSWELTVQIQSQFFLSLQLVLAKTRFRAKRLQTHLLLIDFDVGEHRQDGKTGQTKVRTVRIWISEGLVPEADLIHSGDPNLYGPSRA
jgi:hypothetical protein